MPEVLGSWSGNHVSLIKFRLQQAIIVFPTEFQELWRGLTKNTKNKKNYTTYTCAVCFRSTAMHCEPMSSTHGGLGTQQIGLWGEPRISGRRYAASWGFVVVNLCQIFAQPGTCVIHVSDTAARRILLLLQTQHWLLLILQAEFFKTYYILYSTRL